MPGNFYPKLEINDHGCITPAGPFELAKGEKVLRLDVWVWQDSSACMAIQRDFPHRDRWSITTDPHADHVGPDFRPGAAVAMGLMVSEMANGDTKTFQWTDAVLLYSEGLPAEHSHSAAQSDELLPS